MNYLRRLPFYLMFGALTMRGFKTRLALRLNRIQNNGYASEDEQRFIESDALRDFCLYEVPYQWRLTVTHGGGMILLPGLMTVSQAMKYVAEAHRDMTVIHVDSKFHFIFTKPTHA